MPLKQTPSKPAASEVVAKDSAGNLAVQQRSLPPAAQRALVEAAARRAERDRKPTDPPQELNGRGGLDPTRYGDWEVDGLASDF